MHYDFLVKIPDVHGKITRRKKGPSVYIEYEYAREYKREKQYTIVRRATIGKQYPCDPTMMYPNQNYYKHFPEATVLENGSAGIRSSCIRAGAFFVIEDVIRKSHLDKIVRDAVGDGSGLFLDLAAYSLISEDNAAQYYPDYAFNHPLFSRDMHIYSDTKISKFLQEITDEQIVDFLNRWNENRPHDQKIYISYDSTNKKCQAGDIEMVEIGKSKDTAPEPIFNYSVAYDTDNQDPLFYEEYPGSIVDVSQLQYMLDKAKAYGYRNSGFILDRGYFSKKNIKYLDENGFDFIMFIKGLKKLVSKLVIANYGSFEKNRNCYIKSNDVYAKTVVTKLYEDDEKDRYIHLCFSFNRQNDEINKLQKKLNNMEKHFEKYKNCEFEFPNEYGNYYTLFYKDKKFLFAREKQDVVEMEMNLCGYFALVTSARMTAKDALELYDRRDQSEKLFRSDKTFLGNKPLRVYSNESASAKIFIGFVALIIRCRLYRALRVAKAAMQNKQNYMTVPAAMKDLEKIELIKQFDGVYRLDHAVTAKQKIILQAFDADEDFIREKVRKLSADLRQADKSKSNDKDKGEDENAKAEDNGRY